MWYLGDCTFNKCTSLKSITLPSSITALGFGTFDRVEGLSGVKGLSGKSFLTDCSGEFI